MFNFQNISFTAEKYRGKFIKLIMTSKQNTSDDCARLNVYYDENHPWRQYIMLRHSGDIYHEVNEKVGRNGDFYSFVLLLFYCIIIIWSVVLDVKNLVSFKEMSVGAILPPKPPFSKIPRSNPCVNVYLPQRTKVTKVKQRLYFSQSGLWLKGTLFYKY